MPQILLNKKLTKPKKKEKLELKNIQTKTVKEDGENYQLWSKDLLKLRKKEIK